MMTSDFIVEVSDADFEYQVLVYSQQTPVVVDFWAEWCAPCKMIGPILERLAQEGQGSFRLAKVNVDENPELVMRYSVRSIPAVMAFRDGRMVAEFKGAQPEPRIREFLKSIAPSPEDLTLEKANSLLSLGNILGAEKAFREVLQAAPNNPTALLGLAKSLLLRGQEKEALSILASFPASKEYHSAEQLRPLAEALSMLESRAFSEGEHVLDAAFANSLRLVKRGNLPAAMDGLLDILREDKRFRDGLARKVMLALIELVEDPEMARQYRNELASVLF